MSTQATFFDGSAQKKNFQSNDIDMIAKAMSGDMAISISPATTTKAAGTFALSRDVTVKLVDADGNVHTWFNKAITSGCSIADTSTAATAAIDSTTMTFVNGVATKTVTAASAAWVATETNTLTIANLTVMGTTVTGGTSVQTITA